MNSQQYKTIYSKIHGCLIAVAENASSQGKATGASTPAHSTSSTSSAIWGAGFCGALSTTFAFVTRRLLGFDDGMDPRRHRLLDALYAAL